MLYLDHHLDEPFRNQEIFIISLFSIVHILVESIFLQFLVDILPFGSGSMEPHIFADPDPKHWFQVYRCKSVIAIFAWRVT